MSRALFFAALALLPGAAPSSARPKPNGTYLATAYSTRGETKDGDVARRHIAAADPRLLPLGSRIRIANAGAYSGEYTVADTGSKIHGRKVDIFIPNAADAKKFGKRRVRVQVVELAPPAK